MDIIRHYKRFTYPYPLCEKCGGEIVKDETGLMICKDCEIKNWFGEIENIIEDADGEE